MSRRRRRRGQPRRRRRMSRRERRLRLIVCGLVITIVTMILVMMIGWNRGIKNWMLEIGKPVVKELDLSGIDSTHAVLMQVNGGKVIGEIGGEDRIYPASLTKIMTAVIALEEIKNLKTEITLTADMFTELYANDLMQAGFQPDERVRAIDLLYGALLPSGAECCMGLAVHVAGSEEAFVELMNKKAREIGMDHTNFCNTIGTHEEEHYSTAKDMAILLKYALGNSTFRKIMESSNHFTPGTNIHPDGIGYWSSLLRNLPDQSVTGGKILGGKTGYTNAAGFCLASYANIEGRDYVLVTTGAVSSGIAHIQDAVTVYNRLGAAAQAL